ncbi:MAG: methylmalonyl-CoA epimerase [Candidatus Hydrothermarchaeota archaeon]
MIKKIQHIGVAVKDLKSAMDFYENVLGLKVKHVEVIEDQKVKVAFIPIGETNIELLEATEEDSPVARHIEKRGEGLHHIALAVDDIEKVLEDVRNKGVTLIDEKPRIGAHNDKIAFLHPKSTYKVLLELVEEFKEQ